MATNRDVTVEFEQQRSRLFALAYRLLGSAGEAEDAVQDAYLRWHAADHSAIATPAAWLTKVLTNLCLNRLASARARREAYVGMWLPEPVPTGDGALGPMETAEQRESVSMAVLVMLERLTPAERGVFVLREAFGYGHREIAEVLDITEAGSQQLYRRARAHLDARRTRFEVSGEHAHRVAERFLAAARAGDLAGLERLLTADVVSWADGGGRSAAARNPVRGAARVARYLAGLAFRQEPGTEIVVTEVNGLPGLVGSAGGRVYGVMALEVTGDRVSAVRIVVNPDKLTRFQQV
ncbi:MAG: polymerase sigma-70 factor [Nonomuraea muscovyensis]|uniref:RNA polymerase sigma-70 factor (ECF subfamily) n=1 Tax=Nonomuraea muscovyensis TaxID=1124761 RepID=A0A7X0F0V0_9ACTN|nr:RNA polymerase sigma-70 factor [Nonomuraea muscovyensis]MBB6351692.1 RNA polymerase sigma-70 factor (ECF subfamily) [Nonomuraea muscovyensis]MDF2705103.1 polymerase sigma-70 factor [Nonomuraea muscovyensis]